MTTNARLRAFVALADTGSIRAAARALVLTESSVSSAVSALGEEVGAVLVEHVGRGVRVTPAGELYADYARRILGLHEEALHAARAAADPERGTIRIAAVTTAGEHLMPTALASFCARYPDIDVGLEVRPRGIVWPMLRHHEVDLVVAGRPPDDLAPGTRAVSPNTLVVVGTPQHAQRFTAGTVRWLLREPESGVRATTVALLAALGTDPPQLTLGSPGAVVTAAVSGLGVTLVPRQAVRAQLEAGALVELPVPGTPLHRPWHAVSQAMPTPSAELLIGHLLHEPGLGWHRPRRPRTGH